MSGDRIDKLEDMIYKTYVQQQELIGEVGKLLQRLDTQADDVKELKDDNKILDARVQQNEITIAKMTQQLEANKTVRNIIVGGVVTFVATIGAIAYQASIVQQATGTG